MLFRSGVAVRLGLGYEALKAVRPDLVMVSMPAFRTGAWQDARAYGFTLEQASGLPTVAGNPDGPPLLTHYAYGDPDGGADDEARAQAGKKAAAHPNLYPRPRRVLIASRPSLRRSRAT